MDEFSSDTLPREPPFTLGHENAGWVHRLGEGVRGFEIGQPVAVYGAWGCGACSRCSLGVETYCEDMAHAPVPGGGGGLGLDGGMAHYMLVPNARHLVPLPEGLEPAHAAPLTDAGLTPYHAVRRSLGKLTPDATAVVIGVGGLGHVAVQIIKPVSAASIIAVERARKRSTWPRVAALIWPSRPGPRPPTRFGQPPAGHGADVVLDFVGSDSTLALGVASPGSSATSPSSASQEERFPSHSSPCPTSSVSRRPTGEPERSSSRY